MLSPTRFSSKSAAMGRMLRRAAVQGGRLAKPALGDRVFTVAFVQATRAVATQTAYKRYNSSERGWLECAEAQGIESNGRGSDIAKTVAEYMYYRTGGLVLMPPTAGQLLAAVGQYYETDTGCRAVASTVMAQEGGPTSISGNPASFTEVKKMKEAHKKALARAGSGTRDSVDAIEPVHVRRFFSRYLSYRSLSACDRLAIMLHATHGAVLMGLSSMMRFNGLSAMTTEHFGRSESFLTFSFPTWTKMFFKKKFYELTPWPTAVKLGPRHVYFTPSVLAWTGCLFLAECVMIVCLSKRL